MELVRRTKIEYERYLNERSPPFESPRWVIAGKLRTHCRRYERWGTALRQYAKPTFNFGYAEWKTKTTGEK